METTTTTPVNPLAPRVATNYTLEPDATMRAILEKKASGAKLTPSEGGLMGAFKKKLKATFGGVAAGTESPGVASSAAVASPANNAADAPGDGFPAVPPDSDLVRRTVESLLEGFNGIGNRKLLAAARARGSDDETLRRYQSAKVFGDNRKSLIVSTSPQAFEAMGITNGKAFALSVFWGNIGLGACDFWMAIDELNNMAKRPSDPTQTTASKPSAPVAPSAINPQVPGQPPGLRIPQAEPPPPMQERADD